MKPLTSIIPNSDYDYNYYGGLADYEEDRTRHEDWDLVALRQRYSWRN